MRKVLALACIALLLAVVLTGGIVVVAPLLLVGAIAIAPARRTHRLATPALTPVPLRALAAAQHLARASLR